MGVVRSRKYTNRQYNDLELEDTMGVIRSRKYTNRQYNDLELEDTMGVIRSSVRVFTASEYPHGIF
jgi:hypothetical protein